MKQFIFNGKVEYVDTHDDESSAIGIIFITEQKRFDGQTIITEDNGIAFAQKFENEIGWRGSFASIRFFTDDEPIDPTKVEEQFLTQILGGVQCSRSLHYSDYTGYLWTDADFNVGGHDLLKILNSNLGKYIHFEMELYDKKEVPKHIMKQIEKMQEDSNG